MGGFRNVAELAEADKERIVVLLGRFKRPVDVVQIMLEEHGVEVTHDQVTRYNPQHAAFRADRDKWEPIFNAAREAYVTDIKAVVVANQSFRLNELHDLYKRAKSGKNYKLAADLLEQIARETGGALTNQRELTVNGNKARNMDSDDRRSLLGSLIAEELSKRAEQQAATKH
jgi:hypothetical protein